MQQIAANLLHSAKVQAYNQASHGLIAAEVRPCLAQAARTELAGPDQQHRHRLLASGQNPGADYGVAITVRPNLRRPTGRRTRASLDYRALPQAITLAPGQKQQMIFASMPYPDATDPRTSGLLYAARFGSAYNLYYFFPLDQLQNELFLIQRTLVLVGAGPRLPAGRDRVAGHQVGGRAGGHGGAGRQAAVDRKAGRAARGARQGREWPRWPPRSTRWRRACRTRCANSRNCPRCSGSSSPTSRMSCARR